MVHTWSWCEFLDSVFSQRYSAVNIVFEYIKLNASCKSVLNWGKFPSCRFGRVYLNWKHYIKSSANQDLMVRFLNRVSINFLTDLMLLVFLYPLKTSENFTVFWCVQGGYKEASGMKWVDDLRNILPSLDWNKFSFMWKKYNFFLKWTKKITSNPKARQILSYHCFRKLYINVYRLLCFVQTPCDLHI